MSPSFSGFCENYSKKSISIPEVIWNLEKHVEELLQRHIKVFPRNSIDFNFVVGKHLSQRNFLYLIIYYSIPFT